jgi:hypothetical protein
MGSEKSTSNARHHGGVHAAKLGSPLVERHGADEQLSVNLNFFT